MGHAQRRRGNKAKHEQIGKSRKKIYQKNIEQIVNDLEPQNIIKFNKLEMDEEFLVQADFIVFFMQNILLIKMFQKITIKQKDTKKELKEQKKKHIQLKIQKNLLEK